MGTEAVTLVLDGTIELADLATAIDRFNRLVHALADEAGAGERIGWVVSGLELGSATMAATATPSDEDAAGLVQGVVHEYLAVARRAGQETGIDADRPAARLVCELTELTERSATEVRFETAESEVVFTGPAKRGRRADAPRALSSVTGRVQTLQARGALRFTLYDLAQDKAISCFLRPGSEDLMRGAWGHLVEVTGMVSRDPVDDRPRSVRDITDIHLVAIDEAPGRFMEAEGVLEPMPGAPSSEKIVRTMRDAG